MRLLLGLPSRGYIVLVTFHLSPSLRSAWSVFSDHLSEGISFQFRVILHLSWAANTASYRITFSRRCFVSVSCHRSLFLCSEYGVLSYHLSRGYFVSVSFHFSLFLWRAWGLFSFYRLGGISFQFRLIFHFLCVAHGASSRSTFPVTFCFSFGSSFTFLA
jgi:hypothetical protein